MLRLINLVLSCHASIYLSANPPDESKVFGLHVTWRSHQKGGTCLSHTRIWVLEDWTGQQRYRYWCIHMTSRIMWPMAGFKSNIIAGQQSTAKQRCLANNADQNGKGLTDMRFWYTCFGRYFSIKYNNHLQGLILVWWTQLTFNMIYLIQVRHLLQSYLLMGHMPW